MDLPLLLCTVITSVTKNTILNSIAIDVAASIRSSNSINTSSIIVIF